MNTSITKLRRVRLVEVTGLFGLYNHKIELNDEERVTIIHGPNGVGKTMLLRMLSELFNGHYSHLRRIPFTSLTVGLDGGDAVTIVRKVEDDERDGEKSNSTSGVNLFAILNISNERVEVALSSTSDIDQYLASRVPFFHRLNEDLWEDERDGEVVSEEDLKQRYLSPAARQRFSKIDEPAALKELRSTVRTHLIEAQRLIQLSRGDDRSRMLRRSFQFERMIPTVEQYSKELQQQIANSLANYAGESQALDQTFPRRLVELRESLSPELLREKLDELETTRKALSDMGLLVASQAYPVSLSELDGLDDAKRSVMTLYVQDTARKLGILREIADRIQLLLESINSKFRNKRISVSRESGLTVTGVDGNEIDIGALSSGEQHEIVILYNLLFRVMPNTLILIDEPELSLHVTWQKKFLPELLAITRQAKIDADA